MSIVSVATRIIEERSYSLQLVRSSRDDGSIFYVYIVLLASRVAEFNDALAVGGFDFNDYGHVVTWGDGINPPRGLTDKVRRHITSGVPLEEIDAV